MRGMQELEVIRLEHFILSSKASGDEILKDGSSIIGGNAPPFLTR